MTAHTFDTAGIDHCPFMPVFGAPKLMIERGLAVPPANRNILSVCVVSLCQGW